jgi:hypothetical protein
LNLLLALHDSPICGGANARGLRHKKTHLATGGRVGVLFRALCHNPNSAERIRYRAHRAERFKATGQVLWQMPGQMYDGLKIKDEAGSVNP